MKDKGLSDKIIGCAHRVYNKMGFGFLESVYENETVKVKRKVRKLDALSACSAGVPLQKLHSVFATISYPVERVNPVKRS